MINALQPGLYVIAVSGGVDSIVLLDLLAKESNIKLLVAHYNHGIRTDAHEDKKHVMELARKYRLPFVYDEGNLGSDASENAARVARYNFLHKVKAQSGARGIITAHHQDDVLETALLNILRGTHRKGMTSLQSTDIVKRPLLQIPKKKLVSYARANGLVWREDSTNTDAKYTRNALRVKLKNLTPLQRQHLLAHIKQMHRVNREVDVIVANHLHMQRSRDTLDRKYFLQLPHKVAQEILASWLRKNGLMQFDAKMLTRIVTSAKTYTYGKTIDVYDGWYIQIQKDDLALSRSDR